MHTNRVAQWIAHQTSNLGVAGSSPAVVMVATVYTQVSQKQLDNASGWFSEGFEALVTLWIAIISAELFNQGAWQRVGFQTRRLGVRIPLASPFGYRQRANGLEV